MKHKTKSRSALFMGLSLLIAPLLGWAGHDDGSRERDGFRGAVYTMTNAEDDNAVVHYGRKKNGELVKLSTTSTGGKGSGIHVLPRNNPFVDISIDPVESSHGLVLTENRKFLLAVNPGDDTVSVFKVGQRNRLSLVDKADSNGVTPISIAIYEDTVYVANGGNYVLGIRASFSGYKLSEDGKLTPIADSRREMGEPGYSRMTDMQFSPDGKVLVVNDTYFDEILIFPVKEDGTLEPRIHYPSAGVNPFGMVMTDDGILVVSNANALAGIGVASVSTYKLEGNNLTLISSKVPNGGTEACWISVTPNGQYAYSSNSPSYFAQGEALATVSSYALAENGEISLINAAESTRGFNAEITQNAGPLESLISKDGKFFYQLYAGYGEIVPYRIRKDGTLKRLSSGIGTGLPLISVIGLAGF